MYLNFHTLQSLLPSPFLCLLITSICEVQPCYHRTIVAFFFLFQALVKYSFLSLVLLAGLPSVLHAHACVCYETIFLFLLVMEDGFGAMEPFIITTRDISGFFSVGRFKDENNLAIFIGLEKASLMTIFSMRFHVRLCSFLFFFFVHCEYSQPHLEFCQHSRVGAEYM